MECSFVYVCCVCVCVRWLIFFWHTKPNADSFKICALKSNGIHTNKLQSGLQVFALLKITVYCLRLWVIIIKIIINVGVQCVLLLGTNYAALFPSHRHSFAVAFWTHFLIPFRLHSICSVYSFSSWHKIQQDQVFTHVSRQQTGWMVNTCRIDILLMYHVVVDAMYSRLSFACANVCIIYCCMVFTMKKSIARGMAAAVCCCFWWWW